MVRQTVKEKDVFEFKPVKLHVKQWPRIPVHVEGLGKNIHFFFLYEVKMLSCNRKMFCALPVIVYLLLNKKITEHPKSVLILQFNKGLVYIYIRIYIFILSISSRLFVQAFKDVEDFWKFTLLLLYILLDDWPIVMISASNEQLQ